MRTHARAPTLFVVGLAALAGCADGSTGPEPPARALPAGAPLADSTAAAAGAAPELPAGLRAAMAGTLAAALEELDLRPAASMELLHDFVRDVEARRGSAAPARSDRARTVHR